MTSHPFRTALAALALALPGAAYAQRTPPAVVVVVDTGRIFDDCTASRAAQPQIQALVASAQQRRQQLGQPLQAEAQSLQAAGQSARAMPAGAARTAAEASLRQRGTALDAGQNAANAELQRIEQNLQSVRQNVSQQISEGLRPIVTAAMVAHGANIAMDSSVSFAHALALDITNEVLVTLNQRLPSVSVTPLPQ
jgi:Skp family chaperone for outer membrane proteins